ncbi:crotonase/enoyl-CoA hydratase family protein [Hydrogenophaga sp. OTU3427]|uniref:crotonase/enoyl-CoA hydratase family protein n=1 Tax=Hydrogenophaga sp. OTU3427 TaxID=3043856 RepID=UPI00313C1332
MSFIETRTDGPILIVTLNRPDARNAFDKAMADDMEAVMDRYESSSELRAAILCAKGPTFSAGQDLKAAARGERAVSKVRGGFGIFRKPPLKPLIAAVEGHALAGGMELTLCCDLIVASSSSMFGLAEAKHSLVALGGGCFRLPRLLPYQLAMEMLLTAQPKSAEVMHRFGYVNSLVEPGQVMEEALRLAALIAANAPLAVRASKEIAWTSMTERWTDAEAWEKQVPAVQPVLDSHDFKEGLRAFAEKRPPVWLGH